MATVTLTSLIEQVRQRADEVNSTYFTDLELTNYINNSATGLYDLLVSRFEDYYTLPPVTFTISSGTTYALPSNFYKLRGVDRLLSGNEYFSVPLFNFQERNRRSRVVLRNIDGFGGLAYRMINNTLYFLPDEQAQGTYRLWYIPQFTKLVNGSDTLDGINGWEEFIIIDAAIKCYVKQESDPSVLLVEKQAITARIESMARTRDVGQADRVSGTKYMDGEEFRGYFY